VVTRACRKKSWQKKKEKKVTGRVTRDRGYDFLNILADSFGIILAYMTQNKAKLFKILIITLLFEEKANFLLKIVKNCRKL
jgi:hypothetical protein